jgi:hypothetical protein
MPGILTGSEVAEPHPPISVTVNVVVPAPNPVATNELVLPVKDNPDGLAVIVQLPPVVHMLPLPPV